MEQTLYENDSDLILLLRFKALGKIKHHASSEASREVSYGTREGINLKYLMKGN